MLTKDLYQLFLKYPLIDTDTRNIRKGSIFFALKGERFNANKFAAEALEKGAAFVVTDEDTDTPAEKTIRRKSVLLALQQLAAEHRKHLHAKVIGITGTNGKTTTKELITEVLSKKYNTFSTKGNLNNHIGVPLTILSIPSLAEMAVIEMGANHPGEIAELCRIADPAAGIITNIGKAHLEGFGSEQGVFNTKKALFDHVIKKNGPIFLHEKESLLHLYSKYENAITYGGENDSVTGKIISSNPTITAEIRINDEFVTVKTNLFGEYNLFNVMAAATIGNHYQIDTALIVKAIEGYNPTNNRSQVAITSANTLIMDAYNANPSSMSNAIRSFAVSTAEKKAVILGDMLELGSESEKEHQNILHLLEQFNFDKTILVGNEFRKANQSEKNIAFADVAACRESIAKAPMEGFTILIKGSRGIQLEKLKDIL